MSAALDLLSKIKSDVIQLEKLLVEAPQAPYKGLNKTKLVEIARREALKKLTWAPGSEAVKYTKPFEPWFGPSRIAWCACFVTWCLNESGLKLGIQPNPKVKGFEAYTWALVETYQKWGIEHKCYFDNDGVFKPQPGDLVIFDWTQTDIHSPDNRWQDHIGIHLDMSGDKFLCAEGNTSNRTDLMLRTSLQIKGWVRIKEGLEAA